MEAPIALRARPVPERYGVTRNEQRPAMIDFRGHNHVAVALPYAALTSVAFHPTDGVTVNFREHKVVIHGRNLRVVYDSLVDHRLTYVQEDDFDNEPETATFIDAITVAQAEAVV